MNKAIITKIIRKSPSGPDKSYIFVNDNKAICEAISTVGFASLYIAPAAGDVYFTVATLCEFIRDTANIGTSIMDYTFVLACYRKKSNDTLECILKNN